ncbi:recombinase family protein [Methylobacterium sp. J-048]|uniref:recombinase family protein n=1 Tax=Methylobacterium sp. J-048 TaxID=2836635 RepID=UPI001FBB4D76|nr:recombinase family protein [Methylobacterium sp. J-048]MCJ2061051.1 recombinase family protein [Methylobacterium sp. J-048]
MSAKPRRSANAAQHPPSGARPTLRCAIYTRVSTEHGLEQEFNSLDNQREAAEAYVRSQAHEGWRLLPERYDDGGYSGGTLERPALQRLLAAVRERRVDVIVVYKVDRLTRALADFAKLVELFDAHGTSFVSVTQAFNTTTSMGRLTLNVLLSFAQFEREVTGERIRDKIAASKRKGIWMGGVVPLGYRVEARALHVVEEQAEVVRAIFTRYRALGTVSALQAELEASGVRVPMRRDGKGKSLGGGAFTRGHLYKILANPIYVGQLSHQGCVHEGQHAGLVDPVMFDAVQAQLAANHHAHTARRREGAHLLTGRIRDERGQPMTPSHTAKGARRYRYYVSRAAVRERPTCAVRRIAAHALEASVVQALRATLLATATSASPPSPVPEVLSDAEVIATHLAGVTVHSDSLMIELVDGRERDPIRIPWSPAGYRRRREIVVPPGVERDGLRPMKVEDRARILAAIARSRAWVDDLVAARAPGTAAIALREGCSERAVRMMLPLAHLAPRIVRAIVDGRLPRGIGVRHLAGLPVSWAEQERALGL